MSNNAQYLSDIFPNGEAFPINEVVPVSVTFKNTGDTTWVPAATPSPPTGYKLGFRDPQDNTKFLASGRVVLPNSVLPGQEVTISFNVTIPDGTNELRVGLLQEGVEWFGDLSPDNCNVTGDEDVIDVLRYMHPAIGNNHYRAELKEWNSLEGEWSSAAYYSIGNAVYRYNSADGRYYLYISKINSNHNHQPVFPANPLNTADGTDSYWYYSTYYTDLPVYDQGGGQVEFFDLLHTKIYTFMMRPDTVGVPSSVGYEFHKYTTSDRYERLLLDGDWVFMGKYTQSNGRRAKRYWKVNEDIYNSDNQERGFSANCSGGAWYDAHYHVTLVYQGSRNMGGDIGTVNVIDIKYWNEFDNGYELFTYAYDWGIIQWKSILPSGEGAHDFEPAPNVYVGSNTLSLPDITTLCAGGPIPGPYLSAYNGGQPTQDVPYPTTTPSRGIPYSGQGSWEIFTAEYLGLDGSGNRKYAIRTASGYYLSARNGGNDWVVTGYCYDNPSTWETFTAFEQSGGWIAFRTCDGQHYLKYEQGLNEYPLNAFASGVEGDGQKFGMIPLGDHKYFIIVKASSDYGPEFSTPPTIQGLPL
jgi:hypothetical protein